MKKIAQIILSLPQLFIQKVFDNPPKYILFFFLSVLAWLGFDLPLSSQISLITRQLDSVILIVMVGCVFFLAKKNHTEKTTAITAVVPPKKLELLCWGGVGIIFVLSVIYRLHDLAILDPYTDENAHLFAAHKLLSGAPNIGYDRGRFVSYLVYWMYKIASPEHYVDYIYWSRVPSVIVGSLTVFPLYLVTKKVSRPVALIACFLLMINPWAIGVSRYAREYAFFPFVTLIVLNSFLRTIEILKTGIKKHKIAASVHTLFLLLFVLYAMVWDPSSTARAGFLVLGATTVWAGILLLSSAYNNRTLNWSTYLTVGVVVFIGLGIYLLCTEKLGGVAFQLHPRFLNVFLWPQKSAPMMWWNGYEDFKDVVIFLLFVGTIFAIYRKDRKYFLFFTITSLMLLFYYLLFERYYRPRYCIYVLPYFTILIAYSIFHLFVLCRSFKGIVPQILAVLVVSGFLVALFNYQNTLAAVKDNLGSAPNLTAKGVPTRPKLKAGYFAVTGEYHQDLGHIIRYLRKKITPEDVFVTTVYHPALIMGLGIQSERIKYFYHKRENRLQLMAQTLHQYSQGWIIIDRRRIGGGGAPYLPRKDVFAVENETVHFVYEKHDALVYRWKR